MQVRKPEGGGRENHAAERERGGKRGSAFGSADCGVIAHVGPFSASLVARLCCMRTLTFSAATAHCTCMRRNYYAGPATHYETAHEGSCSARKIFHSCHRGGGSTVLESRRKTPSMGAKFLLETDRQQIPKREVGELEGCRVCSGNNSLGLLVASCHRRCWRGGSD